MRVLDWGKDIGRSAASLRLLLLAIASAALLSSCGHPAVEVGYEADPSLMPRLRAILAESPPPPSWRTVSNRGKAAYVVSLAALDAVEAPPEGSAPETALCGTEYYAAAVELADPRYSVSPGEAEGIGLESLETILPPRRALAVDEAWPGSAAYPFARRLRLSASCKAGKSLPAEVALWLREAAAMAAASDTAPLLLAAAGDIQVGEAQGSALLGGESGLRSLIEEGLLERLRSANVAVANLESPVSSRGEANPRKRYHFRMPKGSSAALKEAGFDLLLFGNNHAFDFGPDAFDDSLEDLKKAAMPMVGAGRGADEAARAAYLETKGRERLAFVGFSFFPNESMGFTKSEAAAGAGRAGIAIDEEASMASVRAASASGATVVVLAHGGTEYTLRPSEEARRLYARFADSGAALVLGSHPHLLQGCSARSGSLIAYSLGNFLFTLENEPPEAWKGAVLDFLIYRGKVRGILPQPIVASYYDTRLDPDSGAARRRFSELCADVLALPPLKQP